jgi:tRNA nucleotidyltransferase (CCA-adding enzyme)
MEGIMMSYSSVICEVIPELEDAVNYDQNNPHHDHDLYKHLVLTASNLPKDPILRLAGLIHDIGKPACRSNDEDGISHFYGHAQISSEESRNIARSLKCSKPEVLRISSVIKFHDGVIEENEKAVRRRLNQLGPDGVFDLLDLQRADNLAQKNELPTDRLRHNEVLRKIAHDLIVSNACVSTKTLAINGNDLLARGYKGKQIGKALSMLLDAVINGELENDRDSLLLYLDKKLQLDTLS